MIGAVVLVGTVAAAVAVYVLTRRSRPGPPKPAPSPTPPSPAPTPPAQQMYACDISTNTCVESPSGAYQSKDECTRECVTTYVCDTTNFACTSVSGPQGTYKNKDDCTAKCVQTYDCDTSSGTCVKNAGIGGKHKSKDDCVSSCFKDCPAQASAKAIKATCACGPDTCKPGSFCQDLKCVTYDACPATSAATGNCSCGTGYCTSGQWCVDGQCMADGVCPATSDPLTADCTCGTTPCKKGQYCRGTFCSSLPVCPDWETAASADCACGAVSCTAGQVCDGGACHDYPKCAAGTVVSKDCVCGTSLCRRYGTDSDLGHPGSTGWCSSDGVTCLHYEECDNDPWSPSWGGEHCICGDIGDAAQNICAARSQACAKSTGTCADPRPGNPPGCADLTGKTPSAQEYCLCAAPDAGGDGPVCTYGQKCTAPNSGSEVCT